MENDRQIYRLVASARQVMDVPEEGEVFDQDGPLYITWFAFGHAAVLFYLALHALRVMTPLERALVWGVVALVGFSLAFVLRSKVRSALAMAEVVAPRERNAKTPR